MKEACTKKGSPPWRSSHVMSDSTMNAVSDCSAENLAGAHVEPCRSDPG